MNHRAQIRMLPDGRRVHMQDGPIDLIVEAFGAPAEVERAYCAAAARFVTVLDELCGELILLRTAAQIDGQMPSGRVARRMLAAVLPYAAANFITPMAAVAGAVAEEILGAMTCAAELGRAYVNDGGDIALHLTRGERFNVGMMECALPSAEPTLRKARNVGHPAWFGTTTIEFSHPVRGIATSGWRGRSFSLGIADSVTVLADTAAAADAAATIVANGVDLPGHPAIGRTHACELAPDSDLGERLVTQSVGELGSDEINAALDSGLRVAESLRQRGLIWAAALRLKDETRVTPTSRSEAITTEFTGCTEESRRLPGNAEGSIVHA
jgi:ApbE superfamily uncharacterized protein (UPF0280 family)